MMRRHALLLALPLVLSMSASAQNLAEAGERTPMVTLTATATASVDNDRMVVMLVAEAEKPTAAAAAAEVNTRMAKALAVAKAVSSVQSKTVGYTTQQVFDYGKGVSGSGKPRGWKVAQTLVLETADFIAGAGLATKLQDEGLLLTSLGFQVSPEARRKAQAKLQHEALVEWQAQAQAAAQSLNFAGYRPGHLAINAGGGHPQPMMRAEMAMAMSAKAAPDVAVAGGSSELSVSVSGNAILGAARRP